LRTENEPLKVAGVSDTAILQKTGKSWSKWFQILDAAGCASMDHKNIVAFLADNYRVDPWWQQQVTVAYEQARGLRQKHQTPTGFQTSRSKTVNVPVSELFASWMDETQRAEWLPEQTFFLRKATLDKSLRITWSDGSHVDVNFYPKGEAKSQVSVQQSRLEGSEQVSQAKQFWGEALQRLKTILEC
jgi:hypothetical protein